MRTRRTGVLSCTSALVLSLALAGQAFGAIWTGPVTVAAAGVAEGIATLGASTAVALFHDNAGIYVKRSTDSGASWGTQRTLTSTVGCADPSATIAGSGQTVHVAWIEFPDCGAGEVIYRRSTDRAQTFAQPVLIADPVLDVSRVSVARGPNNVIAILWDEIEFCIDGSSCDEHRTYHRIRVSTDGGMSFGDPRTVASARNQFGGGSALAIGDGVIYVAYLRNDGFVRDSEIRLKRSVDEGSTWSTPQSISNFVNSEHPFAIVATENRAAVAYVKYNDRETHLLLRHTADAGTGWSAPVALSSLDRRDAGSPRLTWQGATLRVAFTQCKLNCDVSRLVYRASADGGATWTAREVVMENDSPAAIGFAGQVLILLSSGTFDPVLVMRGAAT